MSKDETRARFYSHQMTTQEQEVVAVLRDSFAALAVQVETACPPSRERSSAIHHLDDALSDAIKAIARNAR